MFNMRNQHCDEDDQEFDPEAQPDLKTKEQNPYDENVYDPDEEALQEQAEEHDAQEAMGEEHEREKQEERDQKGGNMIDGKTGGDG